MKTVWNLNPWGAVYQVALWEAAGEDLGRFPPLASASALVHVASRKLPAANDRWLAGVPEIYSWPEPEGSVRRFGRCRSGIVKRDSIAIVACRCADSVRARADASRGLAGHDAGAEGGRAGDATGGRRGRGTDPSLRSFQGHRTVPVPVLVLCLRSCSAGSVLDLVWHDAAVARLCLLCHEPRWLQQEVGRRSRSQRATPLPKPPRPRSPRGECRGGGGGRLAAAHFHTVLQAVRNAAADARSNLIL